jgi:ApbE superfamily uncharacterized protein (UPF0280 family)
MREPALIRMLPDGCRLHLHDGPIDLVVEAKGLRENVSIAHEAAARRFVSILDELCAELSLVRSPVTRDSRRPDGTIARSMHAAVLPYSEMCFITPMAAVAGSVAEAVLQSMIVAARLDRAYVNNGGDIAIHLSPGQSYRIGMVERPDRLSFFGSVEVSSDGVVRGIATSGWRGRSFSLGVADAVTVLAGSASAADAAATVIANAVDLPGHTGIIRVPAREISPDSDLGDLRVTRSVCPLAVPEIEAALDSGAGIASLLLEKGLIHSAALGLQGQTRVVASAQQPLSFDILQRSLLHA